MAVFFYGFLRLFLKYRKGKKDPINRFDNPIKRVLRPFFGWNSRGKIEERDTKVYIAHSAVLVGMILLFIGTSILTVQHDIVEPFFPSLSFWYGTFYEVYSLVMDMAGVAVVLGLFYLTKRRRERPDRLSYNRVDGRDFSTGRQRWSKEDGLFAIVLFTIILTGFILEGIRIVADGFPHYEYVSFLGYTFAKIFGVFISESQAETLYVAVWWFHMIVVSAFIAIIPYSKGMHIVTDYLAIATADSKAARRLPRESEDREASGFNLISDLSWRDLISLDACTKCGKCHIACPARTVGQPLSPRDLILDLREHAGQAYNAREITFGTSSNAALDQVLVMSENSVVLSDTIWSCTTCRACVTHCPVGIEHVPLIVNLRRRMVEEGEIDVGIQGVLEKTAKYGNSFGKSNRMRAKWTDKLSFKVKDARKEEVDILWFVGDFASFDPRAQEDTIKVAEILNAAGVNFGIMYDGEKTSGNDIRRVGEEGLFETLVEDNLASMAKCSFKQILTTDPHSLNTLRNEYPDFDPEFIEDPDQNILHYTQVLWSLIDSGKLQIKNKVDETVTYHDPCYLGRYASEYDAPREIIKSIGYNLVEMPRCRENSFCCGAGGGMIWKQAEEEGDRPAPNRIREAKTVNPQKFVVACPKDKVMFGDAAKVEQANFGVSDVTSLLYDAMGLAESLTPKEA